MNSLIKAVAVALVLAAPVASFAQSNQPVTRAQVRAELVQIEKAGYNPAQANDVNYPADIQAAEARVNAQNSAANGVGGAVDGSSASGAPARFHFPAIHLTAIHPADRGGVDLLSEGHH
jgi:hypothetical protein